MEQKTGFKEMFLRLVAIVGLIAVLILGAWGIILLAFNLVGLFSGSVSWSNLFTHDTTSEVATTTAPVIVTHDTTPATAATQPAGTAAQPTAVYTAAPRVSQLYGLADLAVTMGTITRSNTTAGRTSVTFVISNIGTNVAASGWSFNALLPLTPSYTYQASAQQALYPGDKIAYTLTYDDPNFSNAYNNQYNGQQVCSQQYPYTCTYVYGTQYNYNQNQYYNNTPATCYTYNGYQNIAGPCVTYDANGNAVYNSNYNYNNQNTYSQYNPYNPNANYYGTTGSYYPYGGTVTITVDPQNWVPESVEYNNSASKSF